MNPCLKKSVTTCALAAALAAFPLVLKAQESTPAPTAAADEELITLSPFEVSSSSDVGYAARETLAGGRFRTAYKDVSSQVNVMTAEFLNDVAATTLEESFRFSMNVEPESTYFNVTSGSATDTGNPTSPTGGNRTRGLTRSSITHDFFESYVPIDTYNTERFTFVSGANAILFGNGQAGGTIESGFTRADTRRTFGTISTRFSDNGGWRAHFNVNQPIAKKVLALRLAMMRGDEDYSRKPSAAKSHREYIGITLEPVKMLKIQGYYENSSINKILTRPVLVQDKFSPWLDSLSETARNSWLNNYDTSAIAGLNNSAINSSSSSSSISSANQTALRNALLAQGFGPARNGSTKGLFSAVTDTKTQAVFSANGITDIPIGSWMATANSEGPEQYANSAESSNDWSVTNETYYPRMVNVLGNGSQNHMDGEIKGLLLEFAPLKNLTFEFGYNKETFEQGYVDWLQYSNAELHVDINQYLPALWTGSSVPTRQANPNFGKYYLTGQPTSGLVANTKDEKRITGLWQLDFTGNKGWTRWLGSHNLSAGWSQQINKKYEQVVNGGVRIISDNTFTTNSASVDVNNANRQFGYRFYIDSPSANPGGNYVLDLPFDPWNPGTIGVDSAGNPVVASLDDLPFAPYTSSHAVRNGVKQSNSLMASAMSSWLKGRFITTLGIRKDNNQFASWADAAKQPRWDGANNTWFYPSASEALPSRLTNAPYMKWTELEKAPAYNVIKEPFREDGLYSNLVGMVFHATKWMTLSYNKAYTSYATDYIRKNMTGGIAQLDDGRTEDYGITLSLPNDKLSLRLVRYESMLLGRSSSYRDTGVGSPNAKGIRDLIPWVERSYQIAVGSAPGADFAFHPYTDDVAAATIPSWNGNSTSTPSSFSGPRDDYDVLSDRKAHGIEATITANPLDGLSIAFSAAKNTTVESNIAKMYFDFVDARMADWETMPNAPIKTNSSSGLINSTYTIQSFMSKWVVPQLNFLKMVEGIPNPSERKYRFNFTSSYKWKSGLLKGAFAGASSIYRSRGAIGSDYRAATSEDLKYNYLAVASPQTTLVPDFNKMLYAPGMITWDAFGGYEMKLAKGKIKWRIQLNIRNVLNNQSLVPLRAQVINGEQVNTVFNTAEPRQYLLTNSISF